MTVRSSSYPNRLANSGLQRGFTLIELAMVLFIVALVLAGTLIPLRTQMEVRSIADTRRIMDQISEALIGFAQANGRLPCPASPTVVAGTTGAGTELYTTPNATNPTSCTALIGVIPWSTLGVPETDAWGRRFTYRVASVFSDAISTNTFQTSSPATQSTATVCTPPTNPTYAAPIQSSFALCSLGEIAVLSRSIDASLIHSTSVLGNALPAVFVSHGKNGYGGYMPDGVQVAGSTASTDEATNAAGTTTGCPSGTCVSGTYFTSYLFYSRAPTPPADPPTATNGCSETTTGRVFCEFDDIVYMISSATLVARSVAAGRLP